MQRPPWIVLAILLTLAACDRAEGVKKPESVPSSATVERASPVTWNAAEGRFEAGGKPMKTARLWTFDGSTEGFTPVSSKVEPAAGSGLALTVADPTLRSPRGLNVPGGEYPLVLVRITRTAAGSGWDGALYYATANHGETIGYFGKPISGANPAVGETTTLIYDMSRQAAGGADWTQSVIDRIRLDIDDRPGGAFVIRQVAIAQQVDAPAEGAGVSAPNSSVRPTGEPVATPKS